MSSHSYWRIYITAGVGSGSTAGYYTIGEIEMRATPGGADQCNGGTATAHDYYSATYAPAKAFDNNTTTWWASFTSNPIGWIKYAFASGVDVGEIAITERNTTPPNFAPKDFQLQWSDDNTNWTTVRAWRGVTYNQGETKTFRPLVSTQVRVVYGVDVAVARSIPYAVRVATEQKQPFGVRLAAEQQQPFNLLPTLYSNQVATPYSVMLTVANEQAYEGDLHRGLATPYNMTTNATAGIKQPFAMVVTREIGPQFALMVTRSLAMIFAGTVEKLLELPFSIQLVVGGRHPYALTVAMQNGQTFAIPLAANSCTQPAPIMLATYNHQSWQVPVAQANTQRLYDTVCAARRQTWSALWPVAQACGQPFDGTIAVATALVQWHDLLVRNPVIGILSGSWDLSAASSLMCLNGGVSAQHLGESL